MAAKNNNNNNNKHNDVNYRLSPNTDKNHRPLSTYDNLTTATTTATTETPTNLTNGKSSTSTAIPPEPGTNVNEFPFNHISFRFDELKRINTPAAAPCNGDIIKHRQNRNKNLDSHQMDKINSIPAASTSSNYAAAATAAATNAQNFLIKNHEYENDSADTVAKESHISTKPVHSNAKSLFLGLNVPTTTKTAQPPPRQTAAATTSTNNLNLKIHEANVHSSDSTACHFYESNRNGSIGAAASNMEPAENEPLITSGPSTTQFIVMPSGSGLPSSHYQNVPSNSAVFLPRSTNSSSDEKQIKSDKYVNQYDDEDDDDVDDDDDEEEDLDERLTTALSASHNPQNFVDDLTDSTMTNMGVSMQSSPSMKSVKPVTLDNNSTYRFSQSLSQAVYMTTTVPQNIKGTNIMGSHTPTRNSLRHSRMIGMNKGYQIARRRNSLNIKHPILARILLSFHILIGLGISCLGLWLCWWAPSTRSRENPYWSGLILMLSGILGLIVIGFKRIPRHKLRQHLFTFFRINSAFVTVIAAGCTLLAATCAIYHLVQILAPNTECNPANMFAASSACICKFGVVANSTNRDQFEDEFRENFEEAVEFYYRDLSCDEVFGPFKYILMSSSILNSIGFLICTILLILLCMRREPQRVIYTHSSRNRV